MLLEQSVARVQLSVAAAECSCARDCLATRHENTLYPPRTYPGIYLMTAFFLSISVRFITLYRIFARRIALPVILVELMVEQYAAVKQQQQQQAYECFSTGVLLECHWVLLPLLLSA